MLSNPIQSTLRYAAVMHYHKLGVLLVLAGPSHRRTGQSLLPPTNGEAMAESRSILPTSSKRFSAAACSSPSQSYIEMPWHFHAMLSSRSRSMRVVSALTRAKEIDETELEVAWALGWGASSEANALCVVRSTAAAHAAKAGWAMVGDHSALARTTTARRVGRATFR